MQYQVVKQQTDLVVPSSLKKVTEEENQATLTTHLNDTVPQDDAQQIFSSAIKFSSSNYKRALRDESTDGGHNKKPRTSDSPSYTVIREHPSYTVIREQLTMSDKGSSVAEQEKKGVKQHGSSDGDDGVFDSRCHSDSLLGKDERKRKSLVADSENESPKKLSNFEDELDCRKPSVDLSNTSLPYGFYRDVTPRFSPIKLSPLKYSPKTSATQTIEVSCALYNTTIHVLCQCLLE